MDYSITCLKLALEMSGCLMVGGLGAHKSNCETKRMAQRNQTFQAPPPMQFLQEEDASDEEYPESMDEDDEFDQPLLQVKMNAMARRQANNHTFSIPTSSFYGRPQREMPVQDGTTVYEFVEEEGVQEHYHPLHQARPSDYFIPAERQSHLHNHPMHTQSYHQQQQQFAASHHDYIAGGPSVVSYPGHDEIYTVTAEEMEDEEEQEQDSSYEQHDSQDIPPTSSSAMMNASEYSPEYTDALEQQQVQLQQQQVQLQQQMYNQQAPLHEPPRVVTNETNRYTVVGHTPEGQPIYALQSITHSERVKAQPTQQERFQIYRVTDVGGQPRYAYALAPARTIPQQAPPVRHIAREYYVHSNEVLNEMRASPLLSTGDITGSCMQEDDVLEASSSQVTLAQPPTVKKRKPVSSEDGSDQLSGLATAQAQAGAIQRFSTMAGWRQMATWLKCAEKKGDWNRLKLLLSQCAQANLTVELLQTNDTPKFVRKLSKTCADLDVRKVCGDLIGRWKKLIAAPAPPGSQVQSEPKRVGSAKRKTPHPPPSELSAREAAKAKEAAQQLRKERLEARKVSEERNNTNKALLNTAAQSQQASTSRESRRESVDKDRRQNMGSNRQTSSQMVQEINKAKVESESSRSGVESGIGAGSGAKAGTSKRPEKERMAALNLSPSPIHLTNKMSEQNMFEKLHEERKDEIKRPKRSRTYAVKFRSTGLEDEGDESTNGKSNGSGVKKRILSKGFLDAKKRAEKNLTTSKATPSVITVPPPVTSTPPSEKKVSSPVVPSRRVMSSNTFMDALMEPVIKKTVKPVKKKVLLTSAKPMPTASVMPSVMEGLYSDTSKALNKDKPDDMVMRSEPSKAFEVAEPDIAPAANRRIRFADEQGAELVHVRYFEIEEGERMNVSKLSSEDMKHLEMKRERCFIKEQRSLHADDFDLDNGDETKDTIPWRLELVEGAIVFDSHGTLSEAKKIEEERQKTVMRPFYDPSTPAEMADAEEELITAPIPPRIIPLEMSDEVVEVKTETPTPSPVPPEAKEPSPIPLPPPPVKRKESNTIDVQKLMSQLKEKGIVSSGNDLASILNKLPGVTTAPTPIPMVPITSTPNTQTLPPTYGQIHTQPSFMPPLPMPPHQVALVPGLPLPPRLPNGQFMMLPIQTQAPLLNGPVPAGVTPTVGVDPNPNSASPPTTSEQPPYGTSYPRQPAKQCTFYRVGACNYGARCRFAHGDEPTTGSRAEFYGRLPPGRGPQQGPGHSPLLQHHSRGQGQHQGDSDLRRGPPRRGYDRDLRDFDRERRGFDRFDRRRRRSSRSRSRSRSLSPPRRPRSPERRGARIVAHDRDERRGGNEKESSESRTHNDHRSPPDDPLPPSKPGCDTDSPASPPSQ